MGGICCQGAGPRQVSPSRLSSAFIRSPNSSSLDITSDKGLSMSLTYHPSRYDAQLVRSVPDTRNPVSGVPQGGGGIGNTTHPHHESEGIKQQMIKYSIFTSLVLAEANNRIRVV
jgi:hypothetical protein